ncbi:MAG: hypothetical protein H7Z42_12515 [Roseiflexaceae bacterium]|nr:hypothetical protein [Roseiflexaceae bacterium]
MPKVRKLSVEEVRSLEGGNKSQRKIVEEEYDTFLEGYDIGDYGEAELEAGEKRITVRNRLKAASLRRDVALEFRRTKGDTLRFRVVANDGSTPPDEWSEADDDQDSLPMSSSARNRTAVNVDEHPVSPKRRGRRKKSEI